MFEPDVNAPTDTDAGEQIEQLEESSAPAAAVSITPAPLTAGAVVEEWFRRHFFNLGAGISEELYNRIHAAKEDLQSSLADYTRP
jgi:hypothetical protein